MMRNKNHLWLIKLKLLTKDLKFCMSSSNPFKINRNKNTINDTSLCISGIANEYVGEVFDYVVQNQIDDKEQSVEQSPSTNNENKTNKLKSKEEIALNTSIESNNTIKHVANNYIEDMINNLCEEDSI